VNRCLHPARPLLRALACAALAAAVPVASAASAAAPPTTVTLRVIAFNDFHGHLQPGELTVAVPDPADAARTVMLPSGGAAYLAARIAALRAEAPASVVVSAGDLIGASPLVSGLFYDEPTVAVMNRIGLDLNALGNHEFDRGEAELLRMQRGGCRDDDRSGRVSCADGATYAGARFPFVAANVERRADGTPLVSRAVVRDVDGVKVGFIGAVTRSTPGIVRPDGVRGLRFTAEAQAINDAAAALRAQGVRAFVAVVHEGGEAGGGINGCDGPRGPIFEIERALAPDIAVVLSAHTHRAYVCNVDGRVVIQGASFGRLVSVVDLVLDRASGTVRRNATVSRNLPVPNGRGAAGAALAPAYPPLAPDPAVAALVEASAQRAAPLAARDVGRLAAPFDRNPSAGGDHALGRLIADAQLAATRSAGAQVAFTNPGGVRADLRPQADGRVTFGDAFTVQPFGNALVTLTLTGAQLATLLEQQWSARSDRARMLQPSRGFSYVWDPARPVGERVVADSLRLDGRRIDPARSYRVTVNDFLADGGDGFSVLREARDRVGGPLDVDALTAYLRAAAAPLWPDRDPRIGRVR
jgi:5'-nucleotidase